MSIKGYPSQKKELSKLTNYTDEQSRTKSEFVTAQENYSNKVGLDVNNQGLARLHGVAKTTEANTVDVKRVIKNTAHGASKGDVVRFESASANPYFEALVLSVPDANTIILANSTPNDIVLGDSFFILRYVSQRFDQTGSISASTGPVQYNLNGSDTVVYQDTVTPANSRPLPTQYLNTSGVRTDLATETTLSAMNNKFVAATTIGSVLLAGSTKSNNPVYNVYSVTAVTTGAYVQLVASTTAKTNSVRIFDSSGQGMILAVGGAGVEVDQIYVPPGGDTFNLTIPASSRVSYKALTANATTGYLIINFMG